MRQLPLNSDAAALALQLALRGLRPAAQIDALAVYLYEALGPVNFGAAETARPGATSGGVTNELVPVAMWQNIVPTIRVAQWVRGHFGDRPIHVTSGYRSHAYNRAVGGSSQSLHMRYNALDIRPPDGVTPRQMYDALKGREDVGGLGLYSWGCHIDSRHLLGMARWRSHG